MKRGPDGQPAGQQQHHKKHRHSNGAGSYNSDRQHYRRDHYQQQSIGRSCQHPHDGSEQRNGPTPQRKSSAGHHDALSKLPLPASTSADVPAYIPFSTPHGLPNLPGIKPGTLHSAPFKHKSLTTYDRSTSSGDITYERLEFLGDAYIELIASRLIFERYSTLTAGRQSQLREVLVKNETLAEYSRAYGFEDRIEMASKERMLEDASKKAPGNKGFNKVMGDVFEAYVAAVILSDVEHGFAVAEKWLTALWAPKLLESAPAPTDNLTNPASVSADPLATYDPTAKATLQKRILSGPGVRLDYEKYADSVELKGAQLGQSKHFIAVYLTGYGHERRLLGKGEGRNKVEAGNWAAQRAMLVENKELIDECEVKMKEGRERRARERAAAEGKAESATGESEK